MKKGERWCPRCQEPVTAFRAHDLTCMWCDARTISGEHGLERWHGTYGGNTNHRCRCEDCRWAANDYRHRRARAKAVA